MEEPSQERSGGSVVTSEHCSHAIKLSYYTLQTEQQARRRKRARRRAHAVARRGGGVAPLKPRCAVRTTCVSHYWVSVVFFFLHMVDV